MSFVLAFIRTSSDMKLFLINFDCILLFYNSLCRFVKNDNIYYKNERNIETFWFILLSTGRAENGRRSGLFCRGIKSGNDRG